MRAIHFYTTHIHIQAHYFFSIQRAHTYKLTIFFYTTHIHLQAHYFFLYNALTLTSVLYLFLYNALTLTSAQFFYTTHYERAIFSICTTNLHLPVHYFFLYNALALTSELFFSIQPTYTNKHDIFYTTHLHLQARRSQKLCAWKVFHTWKVPKMFILRCKCFVWITLMGNFFTLLSNP